MSELREKNFVEKKRYEIRNGKFGTYFYDTEEEKDMTLKEIQKFLNLFWINFENSNKNEIASHEHGLKLENKITQLEKEIEELQDFILEYVCEDSCGDNCEGEDYVDPDTGDIDSGVECPMWKYPKIKETITKWRAKK